MRRSCLGIGCLLLGLGCGGSLRPARAADLPRDFANKYQAATADYASAYSHATVSGTLLRELPQERKRIEQHFIFRSSGNRQRLDLTTTAQENMGATIGKVLAYIATPIGASKPGTARKPRSSKTLASWATPRPRPASRRSAR